MSEIKELVKKVKEPEVSGVAELIEREKKERLAELERLKLERLVEEEKKKIRELQEKGGEVETKVATSFLTNMLQLANVDPQKAVAFLRELNEDDLRKLSLLMASGGNNASAFLTLARSPGSDVKTLVEFAKLLQPQQQITLEGVAALMKTAFELAQSKQPQSETRNFNALAEAINLVKPFYDKLIEKDREVFETRLKQLEEKIVDPRQWLESVKSDAQALGFFGVSQDKEVEKLKLDLERWKIEEENKFRKWMAEHQINEKRWEQITSMLTEGPVAKIIERVGRASAERIKSRQLPPRIERINCPKCGRDFFADVNQDYAVCPYDGTLLKKPEVEAVGEKVDTSQAEQPKADDAGVDGG